MSRSAPTADTGTDDAPDAMPGPTSELARQRVFPEHRFQFSAHQLCFMCKCLSDTRDLDGAIVEIGCEYGHTTVFLNNYIDDLVGQDRPYYAIDTFSGFTESDVRFEADNRGKQGIAYQDFKENRKDWFERTLRINRIRRVRAIEADINEFDLPSLGPLSFVLLDVDLYRPTRKALPELYEMLRPGGVIVVDDCNPASNQWDGAYQAYIEFVRARNITPRIMYNKLGVLRKPLPETAPS
ncbi:Macrocin-O-methyltransferase (TylF) [Lysobacter sp. yr284]|uniref:TylF/MycF/NovP-related O-methyltransferase n=1 Tax=Lysobacter sp. yr284 TaxID=1761791 RepID=UPI00089C3469|nr:TylF/MycF/NovP-related O-methyltransferase [Lysobacter sp. yr284]SDY56802.1 Macrocin-O-methyltransferase (TylF) [Lysobacter sp. yr284]